MGAYFHCKATGACPPLHSSRVFDTVRQDFISFGGFAQSGSSGDETWRFKNGKWLQLHPAHLPAPRNIPVLIFDQARGVAVMYGGRDVPQSAAEGMGGETGFPFAADTWTWDGSDWTEQQPPHHPVLFVPTATYDFVRNQVVLLGFGPGGMETWTYDGNDWTRHEGANAKPHPPRAQTRMAFDAASKSVIAFGGFNPSGVDLSAVWQWDGHSWVQTAVTSPFNRLSAECAPDQATASMLIYDNFSQGSTWRWDGSAFRQLQPAHQPNLAGTLSPDPLRHRVLLLGWTGPEWQVWSWSGTDWTRTSV
ncbi:MAG: hypothetical protein NVS9B11_13430 [Candidatus Dormibacteraceae bacterium]